MELSEKIIIILITIYITFFLIYKIINTLRFNNIMPKLEFFEINNNLYLVDERGNMWDLKKHSSTEIKLFSKSLIGCFNCINCINCVDCNNCINCDNCVNCKYCRHCSFLKNKEHKTLRFH